jgi:Ser/Thr protein kinase RdoA (MazF antagonist)
MKYHIDSRVLNAIDAYQFPGEFAGFLPYGCGHINDTYALYFQQEDGQVKRYFLQRVNTNVFRKPKELMENIVGVTSFLRDAILKKGGNTERETINVLKTANGNDYYMDEYSAFWRCYVFIENTITLQVAEKPEHMYEAARVFGRFQSLLSTYPADTLYDTIPHFHDTKVRFRTFLDVLDRDPLNRAKDVHQEVDFVLARKDNMGILVDLADSGKLPLRVTHNDTKLNNVLFDKDTGEGLCAVDLDTVMPGLSLYDFGDAIRFGSNPAAEDETDLSKVWMEETLFEAYTKGYLEEAGDALTENEIQLLPVGAKLMTLECGMRFLTDYLQGDTYFKIHREHHNLDRCRTQFKLVADMEEKWDLMHKIVSKYSGR